MPAIPEFVLRKLYVNDSLKPCLDGFTFELNNTFAPVSIITMAVTSDENLYSGGQVFLSMAGYPEMPAAGFSAERPFNMPANEVVTLRVVGNVPTYRLVIRADTVEVGVLQFRIQLNTEATGKAANAGADVEAEQAAHKPGLVHRLSNRLNYFSQVFRVQQDAQHPTYHFTPPANWMNDPNGLIYWKGNYHLFYQYNPFEPTWGNIHWGHAVSRDMLHWKNLPIALAPDPSGPDSAGCFSGCLVDNNGVPTILYTGVFPEVQCLATGDPAELKTWKKHPEAVISAPPEGLKLEGFRDPCVWKQGDEWRMVLGAGITGAGGAVLLYKSTDLVQWQYVGILFRKNPYDRDPLWTGTMWECPSFFKLDQKWVLILSARSNEGNLSTLYYTGNFKDDQFLPDSDPQPLDFGVDCCFYAPQTFVDARGRRVMFGWLREARDTEEVSKAGWSGVMSLPRVLTLNMEGELQCAPYEKMSTIRQESETLEKSDVTSQIVEGAAMEILVHIPPTAEQWSGVHISCGKNSAEHILVGCDHINSAVVVDCRRAGGTINVVPVTLATVDEMTLHIFVDGSVLELFVDEWQAMATRFYVRKPQEMQVHVVGDATADLWKIGL